MFLRCLCKCLTLLNIPRYPLIRLYLRCHQVDRFLRQGLGQADNAIKIPNQIVSRMNDNFLLFAIEPDRYIDLLQVLTWKVSC